MKKSTLVIVIISLTGLRLFAQSANEKELIKKTITTFFDGMRTADTAMIRGTIAKGMVLQSVGTSYDGATQLIMKISMIF